VGKTMMVTNNDYTGSCIQPTNERSCLKRKRSEKVFRGKSDCSANGCGQVLKLQSTLPNQFASYGEGAGICRQKVRNVSDRAWTSLKRVRLRQHRKPKASVLSWCCLSNVTTIDIQVDEQKKTL